MIMPRALVAMMAASLAMTATAGTTAQSMDGNIAAIASPAGPSSAQPQLTVSARGVLLSWIERAGDVAALKFSERKGDAWTTPRTVASGRDWFVNWADVPSVIRLADGSLYGQWLQKSGPDTYAYDVRLARSMDDGQTWSPSFMPHNDGTKTEHGFASLFQMPGAGLGLIWLDGRAMKSGHGEHGGGEMSVRGAIYDQKGRQISEAAVDLRVCECCPTTAAVTADGPIVAYRDRSATEIRDIFVSRLVAGKWTEGVPVHRDNWQIAACPVNGPALSANGKTVALAWFTAKGDQGHNYVAFSTDSGKSFGKPVQLDDASALGRVDVALLDDGSAAATWIEFADGKSQFKMRRVRPSGEQSPAITVSGLAAGRSSGYPRMARFGNELIFAWTESGTPSRVLTARVGLNTLQTSRER
ncbi:MAG TPA: sialidase family protein [Vicinamibacterales bacterium]|nr:sialidase family protein [Vicinamibacterales bacterium]